MPPSSPPLPERVPRPDRDGPSVGDARRRPTVQHGFRLRRWGDDPAWETFPVRRPGNSEVLVKVEACGVGLTVLNLLRGDLVGGTAGLPRVPGHELVGTVLEAGANVDPDLVGRRITAYFYLYCGECEECTAGLEDRCRRLAGLIGQDIDGGYAQYATLPARNVIRLPDGLDPVAATVIADAVATPVHISLSRARLGPWDRVAVIGAGGGVGVHLVQVAILFGAMVAGLDVTDEKLARVAELGATPLRSDDFESLDPRIWPAGGPTVVVDFLGRPESAMWALRAVEPGGRVVVMTSFRGVRAAFEPRHLVEAELTVMGSRYATRREVQLAAELVASGRVRPIIGVVKPAAQVLEIHDLLRAGRLVGRGAITWR